MGRSLINKLEDSRERLFVRRDDSTVFLELQAMIDMVLLVSCIVYPKSSFCNLFCPTFFSYVDDTIRWILKLWVMGFKTYGLRGSRL